MIAECDQWIIYKYDNYIDRRLYYSRHGGWTSNFDDAVRYCSYDDAKQFHCETSVWYSHASIIQVSDLILKDVMNS